MVIDMPRLEVSETVFQRIQRWAVPLVDTTDSVLVRILDAAERSPIDTRTPTEVNAASETVIGERPHNTKRPRTLHVLLRKGLLTSGTKLVVHAERIPGQRPNLDEALFRCTIGADPRARQNVVWDYDGRAYSLSTLTEKLRDDHGVAFSQGALNGYWHWALASQPEKSLWKLAEEVGRT